MKASLIMGWVTLITANVQMWIVPEQSFIKYFGFAPWIISMIVLLMDK